MACFNKALMSNLKTKESNLHLVRLAGSLVVIQIGKVIFENIPVVKDEFQEVFILRFCKFPLFRNYGLLVFEHIGGLVDENAADSLAIFALNFIKPYRVPGDLADELPFGKIQCGFGGSDVVEHIPGLALEVWRNVVLKEK